MDGTKPVYQPTSDTEYWRSKVNDPMRAQAPDPQPQPPVRNHLPAAILFSTIVVCVTAIIITVIAKV